MTSRPIGSARDCPRFIRRRQRLQRKQNPRRLRRTPNKRKVPSRRPQKTPKTPRNPKRRQQNRRPRHPQHRPPKHQLIARRSNYFRYAFSSYSLNARKVGQIYLGGQASSVDKDP